MSQDFMSKIIPHGVCFLLGKVRCILGHSTSLCFALESHQKYLTTGSKKGLTGCSQKLFTCCSQQQQQQQQQPVVASNNRKLLLKISGVCASVELHLVHLHICIVIFLIIKPPCYHSGRRSTLCSFQTFHFPSLILSSREVGESRTFQKSPNCLFHVLQL